MKRISFILAIFLFFIIVLVSSFGEDRIVVSGHFYESLRPETRVIVYVSYPGSEPVSYSGETVANLDDAIILNIKDKLFYVRKRFIEKLVIIAPDNGEKLAMIDND